MICPKCKGKAECFEEVFNNGKRRREILVECDMCHGSGEVPMTNDEWRRTCSTEEYATWLWKHFDDGEVIVLWEKYGCPMHKDDDGISRANYTEAMKQWLKEIHR